MLLVYIESKVKKSVLTFWLAFTGKKRVVLYSYVEISFTFPLFMLDVPLAIS